MVRKETLISQLINHIDNIELYKTTIKHNSDSLISIYKLNSRISQHSPLKSRTYSRQSALSVFHTVHPWSLCQFTDHHSLSLLNHSPSSHDTSPVLPTIPFPLFFQRKYATSKLQLRLVQQLNKTTIRLSALYYLSLKGGPFFSSRLAMRNHPSRLTSMSFAQTSTLSKCSLVTNC